MSKENLSRLLNAAVEDEELLKRLLSTKTVGEIKACASKCGLDIDDLAEADIQCMLNPANGATRQDELKDEQLEAVAGGLAHEHQNPLMKRLKEHFDSLRG